MLVISLIFFYCQQFCTSYPAGLKTRRSYDGKLFIYLAGILQYSVKAGGFFPVLRSRNYLFSALTPGPVPPWSRISAPAPAPAIYCHLKLLYNSSTIPMEVEKSFSFFSSSKLTAVNIYLKNNFGSGSRSQLILTPPAPAPVPTPAPQH